VRFVFLGPPGAGKGTQAARVAARFGLQHASTGDMFRKATAAGSELGRTVKDYLDGGRLVPDALTSRVVEEMVLDGAGGYILDGYPRTLGQAEDLAANLERRGQSLNGVVYFDLTDEEAVARLTGRQVCSRCGRNYHKQFMPPKVADVCDDCGGELRVRSDSAEPVVRKRLAEYHEKTEPLVGFYRRQGLLEHVDASAAPDEVERATVELLGRLGSRPQGPGKSVPGTDA
jgi:adenylate kinase